MGAKTIDEVRQGLTYFVSIDRETGLLVIKDKKFAAVDGWLLGIGSHEFEFKGIKQKKFDVFIEDNEVYQVQIGFYSWVNFRLLNQLLNIPGINKGGKIELSSNMINGNITVFVKWNGKYVKHKYKYSDLKFVGKSDSEKLIHRDRIIDRWYEQLCSLIPYEPQEKIDNDVIDKDDIPF